MITLFLLVCHQTLVALAFVVVVADLSDDVSVADVVYGVDEDERPCGVTVM